MKGEPHGFYSTDAHEHPWLPPDIRGNPLQYSCLENSMDGGVWWATVYGVAKSRTRLSDFNQEPVTVRFHIKVTIVYV